MKHKFKKGDIVILHLDKDLAMAFTGNKYKNILEGIISEDGLLGEIANGQMFDGNRYLVKIGEGEIHFWYDYQIEYIGRL